MTKSNTAVSPQDSKIVATYLREYTDNSSGTPVKKYIYGLHLSPGQAKLYKAFKEKDSKGKFELDKDTNLPLYWSSEHLGDSRAMTFNTFSGGVFKDDTAMQSFITESKMINQMLQAGSTGNAVADQAMLVAVGNYKAQQMFATINALKGSVPANVKAEQISDTFEEETFGQ